VNTILDHVNPGATVPVGDQQQTLLLWHDTDHDGIERYHGRYLLQSVLKSKIKKYDGPNFKVISIKATSGNIQKHLIATWKVMKIILPVEQSETSNLLSYVMLKLIEKTASLDNMLLFTRPLSGTCNQQYSRQRVSSPTIPSPESVAEYPEAPASEQPQPANSLHYDSDTTVDCSLHRIPNKPETTLAWLSTILNLMTKTF
jgi:hypothetical protein